MPFGGMTFQSDALCRPLAASRHRCGAVLQWIVRKAVLPHPPDHPHPRSAQHPDSVRVIATAPERPEVGLSCPRIVLAAGIGQDRQGVAQVLVTGSAEGGDLPLSRLLRHGAHPCFGGQRLGVRVALAPVADLGEEFGSSEGRAKIAEEREEGQRAGPPCSRWSPPSGLSSNRSECSIFGSPAPCAPTPTGRPSSASFARPRVRSAAARAAVRRVFLHSSHGG